MKAEKHHDHGDKPATKRDIQDLECAMLDAFDLLLKAVHGDQSCTKTALDKVFKASEKQTRKLEKLSKPPI